MNFSRKRILITLAIAAALLVLARARLLAQALDPAAVVTAYYAALKTGDFKTAASFLSTPPAEGGDDGGFSEMAGQILQRSDYTLVNCKNNLKNYGTALEMYSTDSSGRYPRSLSALTPNYLRTLPTCPAAKRDSYSESYRVSKSPDAYTLMCTGANHTREGIAPNHPQYTSSQGIVEEKMAAVKPEPPVTLIAFRMLETKEEGERASLRGEETYAISDHRTRIFVHYALRRGGHGWRIDNVAMAASDDSLRGVETETLSVESWLRLNGLGRSFALFPALRSTPTVRRATAQGFVVRCKTNLKNIGTALEMYCTDNSGVFPETLSKLTPDYLKTIAPCPAARSDTYSPAFQSAVVPGGYNAYTVVCGGHHHADAGCTANFPQYTSTQGLLEK